MSDEVSEECLLESILSRILKQVNDYTRYVHMYGSDTKLYLIQGHLINQHIVRCIKLLPLSTIIHQGFKVNNSYTRDLVSNLTHYVNEQILNMYVSLQRCWQ